MIPNRLAVAIAAAFSPALPAWAQAQAQPQPAPEAPARALGVVTINGGAPTSLPTQIPTTMEGVTREQIERTVNATDSEDALKYFPSLLVRKRYIGDYNHAVLSSRASGTGNSARSAVYADGILLSNYLGNGVGGLSFPPRWGLVTPEEIERVDVMYGPFSAAYPGNSVGAVVDYVTRMPTKFEAHAKVGFVSQPFELYNTSATYRAWQASTSAGNKAGDWSWWFNANHTDSHGQPLTFATRLVSTGTAGGAGTPVTGAVLDRNNANAPIYVLGTGTEYHTKQDHLKAKLAYDFSPTLRAAYTFGLWQNDAQGRSASYLRNAAGQAVTSGAISIGGRSYAAVTEADFPQTDESLTHFMHGFSLKSNTRGAFDWEMAASLYDYHRDEKRQNGIGTGTLADGSGTGWNTLALKGTWRPGGMQGAHIVDFGAQQESYRLAYVTTGTTGNVISDVGGRARLQSLYAQDAWNFAPKWKTVLGGRAEAWVAWPGRRESAFSPKAALSYQWAADTVLKASLGRAVRFPTVAELFGAASTASAQFINDTTLRPEKSWTTEFSAEKDLGNALARLTYFTENTRDALYTQTTLDTESNRNVSRVQNVGRIRTRGVEAAFSGSDVLARGLDLGGSITWADSVIKENAGFVAVPGDTLGKQQPNIPKWRATALASYRWDAQWTTSLGARYSGRQYRTLDNSDVNGYTYQGVSKYFSVDLRLRWQVSKQMAAAFGIDNLNNYRFWNFHPYPQRSYTAELKFDL
ncbi:MAG: TonB-dependent receptor [Burkholderiales bacterium]|nr:TonB-dependent receptor [Burkholderiales bacterium]